MSQPTAFRLGTWNLLHGLAPETGAVDPDLLTREAADLACDLLAIQEVDEDQPRSGKQRQTADIAEAMGATDHTFLASIAGTPGEHWESASESSAGARYGIGLISRRPVRAWHVLRLRSGSSGMPLLMPTERGLRLVYVPDEPRVALAAELDGLTVACAHLSFVPGRNIRQLRAVRHWLAALPGPHILIGDFNLPGVIPGWITGWRELARVPTYPAWNPKVQFDHALTDDPSVRVQSLATPRNKISDHRPLVLDLAWPSE